MIFLLFNKVIKMYKNIKEILKQILASPSLEPSYIWMQTRCLRPHGHIYLLFNVWEITINIVLWNLSSKFVEIAGKNFSSNWRKHCSW